MTNNDSLREEGETEIKRICDECKKLKKPLTFNQQVIVCESLIEMQKHINQNYLPKSEATEIKKVEALIEVIIDSYKDSKKDLLREINRLRKSLINPSIEK